MTEEVLPTLPAQGLGARGSGLGQEGSCKEAQKPGSTEASESELPRFPASELLSFERVRRYPVGFQFDGEKWIAAQTALFDLEPLRLVVCDPSEDAVIRLRWGPFDWVFRDWRLPPGASVHSRDLFWPYARVLWKPGELATLDVVSGVVSGAAFVARRIPE